MRPTIFILNLVLSVLIFIFGVFTIRRMNKVEKRMKSVYCFDKNNLLFFNSLFLQSVGTPTTSPLNRFHATFSSSALYLLTFLSFFDTFCVKLCVFLHSLVSLFASDRNMKKREKKTKINFRFIVAVTVLCIQKHFF